MRAAGWSWLICDQQIVLSSSQICDEGLVWQAADADMQGLQQHPNVTLDFLLESDVECWGYLYGGLQDSACSDAVFATLLQEAR